MSLFVIPESELSKEAWRLALRQKSEKEIYQEKVKKMLEEIRQ